jgi:hypothetical protein
MARGFLTRRLNPAWAEDKLILPFHFYKPTGVLDDQNQRVVELSRVTDRVFVANQFLSWARSPENNSSTF